MTFAVQLTDGAVTDLEDLHAYIQQHNVPGKADYVITQFELACASLSENPHCGTYVKDLLTIGIKEYREIFFKPYRIIYRVMDDTVYILLISDGRRDMQAVLQQRLLRG